MSYVGSRQQPRVETQVAPRQPKFEGRCEALKGHVFDCSDARQSDMYTKTVKEIAEYVGRTYPPADATRTQVRIWEKKVDEYVKRDNYLKENIKTLYSLVWGQCTDIMRQRIEALDIFMGMAAEGDGLALIKAIKNVAFNFQSQKYLPHSLHESKRRFYLSQQGKHSTTQAYLEQFQNAVDVIGYSGGSY